MDKVRLQELAGIDGARDVQASPPHGHNQELSKKVGRGDDGQLDHNPDVQDWKDPNHEEGTTAVDEMRLAVDKLKVFLDHKDDERQTHRPLRVLLDQLVEELDKIDFNPPELDAPPPAGGGKNLDASIGSHIG